MKNINTLILALRGDLLNIDIVIAINNQILILEKKLPKSNWSIILCQNIELLIDKLSNHLEKIPNIIPNKNINMVLIILFFNFRLVSIDLILFK